MTAKCMVIDERANSYTRKNGQLATDQLLSLQEVPGPGVTPFCQCFEYALGPEEMKHSGKVVGTMVEVQVREFAVLGGKFRARGKLSVVNGK